MIDTYGAKRTARPRPQRGDPILKARIPEQLIVGTLRFRVYKLADDRLAFSYKHGTKRVVVKRRELDDLRAEAERIATGILNAETAAIDVTAEDRRIFVAARNTLMPLGLHVDAVARDVAAAAQIAPGVSIADLARAYQRQRPSERVGVKVHALIVAIQAEKDEADLSGRWKRDVKNDLKWLDEAFGERDIAEISSDEILDRLRALQKERGFDWKRRNHLRDKAVLLWLYAQEREILPLDRKTAAEIVSRLPKPRRTAKISTYSPTEMLAWITNIRPKYLPWLLVGGFSGVRSEEIAPDPESNKDPLRWEDFRWEKRYISIRPETAKVRDQPRHVPISDNLFAWLEPWHHATGLVCAPPQPSSKETARLGRITGAEIDGRWVQLKWRPNALRHTCISALLGLRDANGVQINSISHVAEICGTSEKKIRTNYLEPMDAEEAAAWFQMMPPHRPENVLSLFA